MLQTNEQSVVIAEAKIESLKHEYMNVLRPLVIGVTNGSQPSLEALLTCQASANKFFNYVETFVGSSGLLGAHANGLWVTGFAETCYAVLGSVLEHMLFLRSYDAVLGGSAIEPAPHAYANMQRMAVEYLPTSHAAALRAKFVQNNLPIVGFDMPAVEDTPTTFRNQVTLSVTIGSVAILGSVLLAVVIPKPTDWQEFVFRGCFAMGVAALGAVVPGFISVKARARGWGNYVKVVAGGAIALFVLMWFFNPPKVQLPDATPTASAPAKP